MAIRSTIPLLLAAKYHLHLESTRSILIGLAAREIWPLRSKYFCGEGVYPYVVSHSGDNKTFTARLLFCLTFAVGLVQQDFTQADMFRGNLHIFILFDVFQSLFEREDHRRSD